MIGAIALGVHIAAGAAALAIGPVAIRRAARGAAADRAGDTYHWLVAIVCLSAALLALLDWSRLWFFVPISLASYGFALAGHRAPRHRRGEWRQAQLRGYGGAYIALTTALLVVSFTSLPALWLLPTLLGAPALHRFTHASRFTPTAAHPVEAEPVAPGA